MIQVRKLRFSQDAIHIHGGDVLDFLHYRAPFLEMKLQCCKRICSLLLLQSVDYELPRRIADWEKSLEIRLATSRCHFRMEMNVQFINQDNTILFQRIGTIRKRQDKTPYQVAGQGQDTSITITQASGCHFSTTDLEQGYGPPP